jgi:hypothetical protein
MPEIEPVSFCGDLGSPELAVVMDRAWWDGARKDGLIDWVHSIGGAASDMMILLPKSCDRTFFLLKWGSKRYICDD